MNRVRLSRPFALMLAATLSLAISDNGSQALAQTQPGAKPLAARPGETKLRPQPAGAAKPAGVKPAATAAAGAAAASTTGALGGGAAGGAMPLGEFGDWTAAMSQTGRVKTCYAMSQPKERQPAGLNRDPAYLFISFRPADKVRNEFAVVMGFPTKDGAEAQATVGSSRFAFVTQDQNAWVKDRAEEGEILNALAKGQSLMLKATSRRGSVTTDRYSLAGFAQALDRARKACQ